MEAREICIDTILKSQKPEGFFVKDYTESNSSIYLRDGAFAAHALDLVGCSQQSSTFFNWAIQMIGNYRFSLQLTIDKINMGAKVKEEELLPCKFDCDGDEDEFSAPQIDGWGVFLWALANHCSINRDNTLVEKNKVLVTLVASYLCKVWQRPFANCWEDGEDKVYLSNVISVLGGLRAINPLLELEEIENTIQDIEDYMAKVSLGKIESILLWGIYPFEAFNNVASCRSIIKDVIEQSQGRGLRRSKDDKYYGGAIWPILNCYLSLGYLQMGDRDRAVDNYNYVKALIEKNQCTIQLVAYDEDDINYHKWVDNWGEPCKYYLWTAAMFLILDCSINRV